METDFYLSKFKKAARQINKKLLAEHHIEVETGVWLNSVVLRLHKKNWANSPYEKPQTGAAIFFSVWINDASLKERKILYNIHALRLRQLNGYTIAAREFAREFREKFGPFKKQWPNVSTDFGPLTLMEGYQKINPELFEKDIAELATKFMEIDFIIDYLLSACKKQ